jgi:hypothetical protein
VTIRSSPSSERKICTLTSSGSRSRYLIPEHYVSFPGSGWRGTDITHPVLCYRYRQMRSPYFRLRFPSPHNLSESSPSPQQLQQNWTQAYSYQFSLRHGKVYRKNSDFENQKLPHWRTKLSRWFGNSFTYCVTHSDSVSETRNMIRIPGNLFSQPWTWHWISGDAWSQQWNMTLNFRRCVKSAVEHDNEFPATRKVGRGTRYWMSSDP